MFGKLAGSDIRTTLVPDIQFAHVDCTCVCSAERFVGRGCLTIVVRLVSWLHSKLEKFCTQAVRTRQLSNDVQPNLFEL